MQCSLPKLYRLTLLRLETREIASIYETRKRSVKIVTIGLSRKKSDAAVCDWRINVVSNVIW